MAPVAGATLENLSILIRRVGLRSYRDEREEKWV
jgi:hypothetical protein